MATFEITGKLVACKETDNFHPYEVRAFEKSGWETTRYRFNIVSGTNRFMVECGGGKWSDDSKNRILTYSRGTKDKKSERIEIPWDKRRDPDVINGVAGYRIFTCNLLDFNEKKEADEETAAKKNHQYIEGTEYAAFVKKLIDSNKYADAIFKVQGSYEFQYSAKDDRYYRTLTVNKIYKQTDDTKPSAELTLDCVYTADSFDSGDDVNGLFNCYTPFYFSNVKENRFIPMTLVTHGEKECKAWNKLLTRFEDEPVRQISLICDMIDGAPMETITYDDMDDATKEMIDLGILTEAEAARDLGGNKFGERVSELVIKKPGKKSIKGSEATVYDVSDLVRKPILEEVEKPVLMDNEVDLFDEI